MTAREETICRALANWADRLDLPVTMQDLAAVAVEVDRSIRSTEPHLRPTAAPAKPGAGPEDARRIARRLEATYRKEQPGV
jgi:hypothetical protein